MEKLKLGIVGLGGRGYYMTKGELMRMTDDLEVVGVCDLYEDRIERIELFIIINIL